MEPFVRWICLRARGTPCYPCSMETGLITLKDLKRARRSLLLVGALFVTPLLSACHGTICNGPECGCDGSGDCLISCERDGCDLSCSQTSGTCGAVCGDECEFSCHDAPHCSSYSGSDSAITCSNVSSCAAECGANCHYTAKQVSSAYVTVGPDSTVDCSNLSSCEVVCTGRCEVSCTQVATCSVECEGSEQTLVEGAGVTRCEDD